MQNSLKYLVYTNTSKLFLMVLGRVVDIISAWFLASIIFSENILQKFLHLQVDHVLIWQVINILST